MASPDVPSLSECRSFTRGFLLACDWAGRRPESSVEQRVPRLQGEEIPKLYDSFRLLPRASREGLRSTWARRERRCRLDEEVGLHSSWLTELLAGESGATLLVALGEIRPELGRDVLRALWPQVKPRPGDEVEVKPMEPAMAGALRRWLFRGFVHAAASPARDHPLDRLAAVDPQQMWLFAQDLGRDELTRVAEAAPIEVDALLRRMPNDQAVQLSRLLGSVLEGAHFPASTDTMQISAPAQASPTARRADAFETAVRHIRAVLDLAETEANVLGSIGLRALASVLAGHPRDHALRVAQKMDRALAFRMLGWRDSFEERGEPCPESRREEILRKAAALGAETEIGTGAPAGGVS
jgi:hypothetical protein